MKRLPRLAGLLVLAVVLLPPSVPVAQPGPSEQGRARGLVFEGLERGGPGGPCGQHFEVRRAERFLGCSHGPDPAPPGRDVRRPVSTEELYAETAVSATGTAAATGGTIPCIGDGVSGKRAQAIYARPSTAPDRYASVAPLIRSYAEAMNDVVAASAADTGGRRQIRWVTTNCVLDIDNVVLSATGDDTFANTMSELRARGYTDPNRKYQVWMDSNVFCGIAQMYADDQPSAANAHNGPANVQGLIARTDVGCWGQLPFGRSAEMHELAHTLGAVQRTAPNSTAYGHCRDEWDTMCYEDGSAGLVMQWTCLAERDSLLDCGHQDYFNTAPAVGSYLDAHWNVADSEFLDSTRAPVNNAFGKPKILAPQTTRGVGGNVGATAQPGEPAAAGQAASRSVWYRVTSPASGGTMTFDTQGSTFDTVVGVYRGSKVGALTTVVTNDNARTGVTYSRVSVATSPNTTYQIKVDGRGGATGSIVWRFGFGGAGPNITSISPTSGRVGSTVTITGTNLLGSGSDIRITFNGFYVSSFVSATSTQFKVTVPSGAKSGPITIRTSYGYSSSTAHFTVTS